jgi:hypothetical protein
MHSLSTARHRSIEEEVLVPASHTHDAIARAEHLEREVARLNRDLSSARVRNSTLLRELTRAASAPVVAGVLAGPDREFDQIVFLSNGIRLEHRWTTERGWCYVQAACVPGTLAAIVDSIFADPDVVAPLVPAQFGGMAVVL